MATKGSVQEDEEEVGEEELEEEGRGRSKRKRLVRTFDVMALELLELSDERCKKMPITDVFKEALHQARTTKSKSARRRQIRHLAGLLRDRDDETEAIRAYLAGGAYVAVTGDESYRDLEALRERLCSEESFTEAMHDAVEQLPHLDVPLVTRLAKSIHLAENDKARRLLFRELRRAADESDQDADEVLDS
jgi:ribosome-associated protein